MSVQQACELALLSGLTSRRSESCCHFTQNSNQVPRIENGLKVSVAEAVFAGMHGQKLAEIRKSGCSQGRRVFVQVLRNFLPFWPVK